VAELLDIPDLPAEQPAPRERVHRRVGRGMRHRHNWLQFVRFGLVGASGYVVNLIVFSLAVKLLHLAPLVGATAAFVVAFLNNFAWNRRWTFAASRAAARVQAARFLVVSVVAFVAAAAILQLLITVAGLPTILAQATSIILVTPFSFAGNKLWSFRSP
jgi:dolichol-phosphate mannosyltransferase